MEVWVVYFVGCIECGVPSGIYGVFDNEVDAKVMYDDMRKNHDSWDEWSGDGFWDYQKMTVGVINTDYPFGFEEEE
tara:strand:- start:208 stop:435 length:228 start_codon:yes stop_codon:yes gene_type:complete